MYAREYGKVVLELPMIAHPKYPYMRGSVDGLTTDGRLVEFKMLAMRKFSLDRPPDHYNDQIQFLMHVLDLDVCDFVEFKPAAISVSEKDELSVIQVKRSQRWWDNAFPVLEKCYKRMQLLIKQRKDEGKEKPEPHKPDWQVRDFVCNKKRKLIDMNQYESYRHEDTQ
jgi:hypothetical protein